VRQLADDADIAPGTVARAYSELESKGVVMTEGARGTRVASRSAAAADASDREAMLAGLLRPVAVAAFHLGAGAKELRLALEEAMRGIFDKDQAHG
jgi:GntR family transcriptional regulator